MQLTSPENARYILPISVAFENHLPPTLYLNPWGRYGRTNLEWDSEFDEWTRKPIDQNLRTPLDLTLEVAYKFYKDSLCPRCGVPFWYSHSTDSRVQFRVDQDHCYSCEELERYGDRTRSGKNPPKRYGVTDVVKPVGVTYEGSGETDPLPSPLELAGYDL